MLDLKNKPPAPQTLDEALVVIDQLWAIIETLVDKVEKVEALEAQVEELLAKQNSSSRNSSLPPSSDSTAQRAKRTTKPRSNRSKGAQPGHQKHERNLVDESEVDNVLRYYPDAQCQCGAELEFAPQPARRHQVFDLPKVRYTVTEHQVFEGQCPHCRKKQQGKLPDWVPTGQMGAGLISHILLLNGQYHLSNRKIQSFLQQHWGLSFSLGAISEAQGKANAWLAPVYRHIGEHVRKADVAHADETRHFRGKELRWFWALATASLCYFVVHYSRGKQAANALLADFSGVVVTDHYAGYNDIPASRRQLCWAHLKRHFVKISERKGEAGRIGTRLHLIAALVFRTRHRYDSGGLTSFLYYRRMRRLQRSFKATLTAGANINTHSRTRNQCQHLLKDDSMCWTFLKHPHVPLTNNTAERAIRPYVIWRKLSFATQSFQGDQFRPMIASIVGTAQRLGVNSAQLLRDICSQGLAGQEVTVYLPITTALPGAK